MLPANRQLPDSYATTALRQTIDDPEEIATRRQQWVEYFRQQGVKAIHGGFIFARRRSGANWFDFTQLTKPIRHAVGDAIERGFRARDLVLGADEQAVLQATPSLASNARITEESIWKGNRWQSESIKLTLDDGLPVTIGMDQYVRDLIERFDGKRTVADCLVSFSKDFGLPLESGFPQGLQIARAMLRNDVLRIHSSQNRAASSLDATSSSVGAVPARKN